MTTISRTTKRVEAMPGVGSPVSLGNPSLQGLRAVVVDGFPNHILIYLPITGGIEVVRVLHGSQNTTAILEAEP